MPIINNGSSSAIGGSVVLRQQPYLTGSLYGSPYYTDFAERFATLLLPTFLRSPFMVALVGVLLTPMATLNMQFFRFRDNSRFRAMHNTQVCSLKAALKALIKQQTDSLATSMLAGGSRFVAVEIGNAGSEYPLLEVYTIASIEAQTVAEAAVVDVPNINEPTADEEVLLYPIRLISEEDTTFVVRVFMSDRSKFEALYPQLVAWVNLYRLPGRSFEIIYDPTLASADEPTSPIGGLLA